MACRKWVCPVPGLVTRRGNLCSDWTVKWSGMLIKRLSHRGRRERMPVRITFCDYRFDPETQNYYVRNRRYSPALLPWGAPSALWRKIHRRGRGGTQRNRWLHGALNVGLKLV